MKQPLVVLLDALIDYAGLFPPAALPMDKAIARYESYRKGKFMWALGRYVVPAERLGEVPIEFPVTVLAKPGQMPDADMVEMKAATEGEIETIAKARGYRTVYVEITDLALLDVLKKHRLRAKIRTGGLAAEAIPPVENVASFIRACAERRLPFKVTAGLHHPIRCQKALTYESDSPRAIMHGFLNVFFAAALPDHADRILREENARAFAFDDGGVWWHDVRVTTEEIVRVRETLFISFGSCSFEEPIDDLRELGWL